MREMALQKVKRLRRKTRELLLDFVNDCQLVIEVMVRRILGQDLVFLSVLDQFVGHLAGSVITLRIGVIPNSKENSYFLIGKSSGHVSNRFLLDMLNTEKSRVVRFGRLAKYLFRSEIESGRRLDDSGNVDRLGPEFLVKNKKSIEELRDHMLYILEPKLKKFRWLLGNDRIVALNVRCAKHHNWRKSFASEIGLGFRNADIVIFKQTVDRLISDGYTVVRMGLVVEEELDIDSRNYFELATLDVEEAELLSVAVALKCDVMVTTCSGPDVICALNPENTTWVVFNDQLNCGVPAWKQYIMPSRLYQDGERISLSQHLDLLPLTCDEDFERNGIVQEKSAEMLDLFYRYVTEEKVENGVESEIYSRLGRMGNRFARRDFMTVIDS